MCEMYSKLLLETWGHSKANVKNTEEHCRKIKDITTFTEVLQISLGKADIPKVQMPPWTDRQHVRREEATGWAGNRLACGPGSQTRGFWSLSRLQECPPGPVPGRTRRLNKRGHGSQSTAEQVLEGISLYALLFPKAHAGVWECWETMKSKLILPSEEPKLASLP